MVSINDQLIIKKASFYSHIFENNNIGLQRNMFYEIRIEFEKFKINDTELSCNIQGGWIEIPIRRWTDINIQLGNQFQPDSEWTFYTTSHDWIDIVTGNLRYDGKAFFIELNLSITIDHVIDDVLVVNRTINTPIEFEGLFIVPQNLKGVEDVISAIETAKQFIDIDYYEYPQFNNNLKYIFKPKVTL